MYKNVSASFREAFKSTYQQRYLKVSFTYKNSAGSVVTENLTQEDIVSGSFSISSSALPNSVFELGGVVSSELNITLWNDDKHFSGAKFKGGVIKPEMGIKTSSGIEWCPLGVFYVDECGKSYGKTINISAVDGLMLFEKAIDYSSITFPCTMQYLFELACSTCGITISSESEQMPSNITTIEAFTDDSITWRDIISACAVAAAGFARMNRSGELEIKTFVRSDDNTHEISYSGMRMGLETDESITISGVAYYADNENYLLGEADYPIIVDSHPVFNAMSINTTFNFRTNICNLYKGMTYYPFNLDFAGDPTVDCGDWVLLDKTDEGDIYSLITEQVLRFETKSTLEAVGVSELDKNFFDKNKAPEADKSGSDISGLGSGEVKPNLLQRSIILPGFEYADLDLFGQTTAGNVLGTVGSDVLAKCVWGLTETSWCWKTPYLVLNLGSTYTLSFLVRNALASGGTIKCAFVQNYNDAYPTKQSAYYKIIGEITTTPSTTAGFEWVSITFNTSDWIPDGSSASVAYKITTRFLKIFVKGCNIYKAKLEMGDKRTAWCLNNQEQLTYNNSYAQSIPALFASKIASNSVNADDFNIDLAVDHPSQYEALYYRYQIGLIEYIYKNGTMTKVDITALSSGGTSGEAYTLTDTDKAEIADAVIAQIGEVGGIAGPKGTTFIPSVSSDGVISWTNDGGLANPSPVNIQGPTGPAGANGQDGQDGSDYVLTDDDINTIAEIVLANIEIPEGGSSGTTTTYAAKLANIAKENSFSKWLIAGDAVLMFYSDYEYTVYKNKNNTPKAIASVDTLYTYINRICLNDNVITALTNDEYSEADTAYIVNINTEEYTTEVYGLNETDSMNFGEELTDYNYDMTAEAFEAAGL